MSVLMTQAGGRSTRPLVIFEGSVPAGTPWTAAPWWLVPGKARLRRLSFSFPSGPDGVLHLRPVIRDNRTGQVVDIPWYGLNAYLSGDKLEESRELSELLDKARHSLGVLYENVGAFPHRFALHYEVDLVGV